jgi:hypothetical protein
VFVIFVLCIVLNVYVLFCVFYFIVLCIVVPLPPGTYALTVNNSSNNNNNNIQYNKNSTWTLQGSNGLLRIFWCVVTLMDGRCNADVLKNHTSLSLHCQKRMEFS